MSLNEKTVLAFGAGALASGYVPAFLKEGARVVVVSRGETCDQLVASVPALCDIVCCHAC